MTVLPVSCLRVMLLLQQKRVWGLSGVEGVDHVEMVDDGNELLSEGSTLKALRKAASGS
jgi:hypothetical protein